MSMQHVPCFTAFPEGGTRPGIKIHRVPWLPPGAIVDNDLLLTAPTLASDQAVAVVLYDLDGPMPDVIRVLSEDGPRVLAVVSAEELVRATGADYHAYEHALWLLSAHAAWEGDRAARAARDGLADAAGEAAARAARLGAAIIVLQERGVEALFLHWLRSQAPDRRFWQSSTENAWAAFFGDVCICGQRHRYGRPTCNQQWHWCYQPTRVELDRHWDLMNRLTMPTYRAADLLYVYHKYGTPRAMSADDIAGSAAR
jgi:hypothetical protein